MRQTRPNETAQHLAELFEHHLNLSESFMKEQPQSSLATPQTLTPQPISNPMRYSISQHYNHSAHISSTPQPPALHPLQPHRDDTILRLLIQNDIPPSSLLRSQLGLFERSNPDERQKLIMLWRLAPPAYAKHGGQELADRLGEYQSVTLEQEEELTWLRYQRNFARTANVRDTVQVERLCRKQSLLGEYFDADGMNGGHQQNEKQHPVAWKDEDGDEEML